MAGKKKSPLKAFSERMRARLWLAEMMRVTDTHTLYQFGKFLDDVDKGKALYRYIKIEGNIGISEEVLTEIDQDVCRRLPAHQNGCFYYLIGPKSKDPAIGFAQLWDTLFGSIEDVWEVMLTYDHTLGVQTCLGVSFPLLCSYLTIRLFGTAKPYPFWNDEDAENHVAKSIARMDVDADIDLITFAIAA